MRPANSMSTSSSPEKSFLAALQNNLPSVLPQFLLQQRWFGGKARQIQSVEIPDIVPITAARAHLTFARVNYARGPVETYAVPLVRISSEDEPSSLRIHPDGFSEAIILKDALTDQQFLTHLFDAITEGMCWSGTKGQVRAISTSALQSLWQPAQGPLPPSLMKAEQSNTSIVYGKRLMLKIFRRLEPGLTLIWKSVPSCWRNRRFEMCLRSPDTSNTSTRKAPQVRWGYCKATSQTRAMPGNSRCKLWRNTTEALRTLVASTTAKSRARRCLLYAVSRSPRMPDGESVPISIRLRYWAAGPPSFTWPWRAIVKTPISRPSHPLNPITGHSQSRQHNS